MKKFTLLALLMLAFASVTMPVQAGDERDALRDRVVLQLSTEGWVTTNSAKVGVYFDIVRQKETSAELKKQILDALDQVAAEAEWHITASSESKGQSGLDRWYVSAEARVQDSAVNGLHDRAEAASRPGFKLRLAFVDFSPSLAETERLLSQLRADIYARAVDEADRLNAAVPGRNYRVGRIDFTPGQEFGRPQAPQMRMMEMQAKGNMANSDASENGEGASELAVSRQHRLTATVMLTEARSNRE